MDRWLTIEEVCALTQWSAPTVYRHVRLKQFPAPVARGRWSIRTVDAAIKGEVNSTADWKVDADAIREAQTAAARRRKGTTAGRNV